MKCLTLQLIAKISAVLILLPGFAFAVQPLNSGNLSEVVQSLNTYQESDKQKFLMPLLRKALREKALPQIWEEYQKNPDLSFGALKAKDLFRKLDKFQLFQSTLNNSLQLDKERIDDFYLTAQGLGVVNKEALGHDPNAITVLALHIFLGSSGWQDENYQLSLALLSYEASLSSPSQSPIHRINHKKLFPANRNELIRNYKNNRSDSLGGDGGFTSVGGGGDVTSIKTKLMMYSYIFSLNEVPLTSQCRQRWENPTRLVMDIQEVEIESVADTNQVQLAKGEHSIIKILIPKFSTKNSEIADAVAALSLAALCQGIEEQK